MWKVVISTQELTEREQQQCREAGVRYFWTKPATVDAREGQQGVRELLAEYRLDGRWRLLSSSWITSAAPS